MIQVPEGRPSSCVHNGRQRVRHFSPFEKWPPCCVERVGRTLLSAAVAVAVVLRGPTHIRTITNDAAHLP